MESLIGKWGRIFIWAEHVEKEVHPDDVYVALRAAGVDPADTAARSREGKVLGDIVESIGLEGGFVTVRLGRPLSTEIRIRPQAFQELPCPPPFKEGERVVAVSKGSKVVGEIDLVCWHLKDGDYYYFISVDGKRLKRRYLASDLFRTS